MTNMEKFIHILKSCDKSLSSDGADMFHCRPRQINENRFAYDFDGYLVSVMEFHGEEVWDGVDVDPYNPWKDQEPYVHPTMDECIKNLTKELE